MKRQEFLDTLTIVRPALLSGSDTQPNLKNLIFNKDGVLAFNGVIALCAPLDCGFTGAVEGTALIALISACTAEELILTPGEELRIVSGKTKIKLPVGTVDSHPFVWPKDAGIMLEDLSIVGRMRQCAISMGMDNKIIDSYGMMFSFSRSGIKLYANDNNTMTVGKIESTVPRELRGRDIIVDPQFITTLCALESKSGFNLTSITFGDGWVSAMFDNKVVLFSSGVFKGKASHYLGVLDNLVFSDAVPIPEKLRPCLERAAVICDRDIMHYSVTELSLVEGCLKLKTENQLGSVKDSFSFPDCALEGPCRILPRRIIRGLNGVDSISFGAKHSKAICLRGEGFKYIVSIAHSE